MTGTKNNILQILFDDLDEDNFSLGAVSPGRYKSGLSSYKNGCVSQFKLA